MAFSIKTGLRKAGTGGDRKRENVLNWDFIREYLPLYQKAAILTLKIGIAGIVLSILIGLLCAAVMNYRIPVIRQIVIVYVEISRNTPLLIQLFFIYYGLPKIGIRTDPEACGIAGLAFLGGSYMAEAFRSGIEAVETIQFESAYSLGLGKVQTLWYVVFPQAVSVSMPALVANVIFLLKETSVFSAIESLFLLLVFYLLILLPVSLIGRILERRLRYAGFGT